MLAAGVRRRWLLPAARRMSSPPPVASAVAAVTPGESIPPREPLERSFSLRRALRLGAQLSKARLTGFVTGTATLGFIAAGPPVGLVALGGVTLGTALCSASASAWNQIYEIRNDGLMSRTRMRPLPSGRMTQAQAIAFACATGAAGITVLATTCNPLTALLGAANIGLYAAVYTPLKQLSPLNTEMGAIVGAIPPLMGWAAATGSIGGDGIGLALFGALFLWQMPHFFALAWRHRHDYELGGYRMISLGDPTGTHTATRTWLYSLALATFPFWTTAAGVTAPMFAIEGVLLNAVFLRTAWKFYQQPGDDTARSVFLASLWYLPLLILLLAFHSHRWRAITDLVEDDDFAQWQRRKRAGALSTQPADDSSMVPAVETEAAAFANDAMGRWLAVNATFLRRVFRAHCPHELVVGSSAASPDAHPIQSTVVLTSASASPSLPAAACPVGPSASSTLQALAAQLPCPVQPAATASETAPSSIAARE